MWHRPKLSFGPNYGLDLQAYKVVEDHDSDVSYEASFFTLAMNAHEGTRLSLLEGSGTYQNCKNATRYTDRLDMQDKSFREGTKFCAFNEDLQRVALFRYLGQNKSDYSVNFEVTIWRDEA